MKNALAGAIDDPATQAAVRRIQKRLNQLPPITGSTDTEKLTSLIAALVQLGLVLDRTE